GFTGQRSDAQVSGLDYYGARYYDPVLGEFASADSVADGVNRYSYVTDNPETLEDPSGNYTQPPGGRPGYKESDYPAYKHPLSTDVRISTVQDKIFDKDARDTIRRLILAIIAKQNDVKEGGGPGLLKTTRGGAVIAYRLKSGYTATIASDVLSSTRFTDKPG